MASRSDRFARSPLSGAARALLALACAAPSLVSAQHATTAVARVRAAAESASALRVVVSLGARRLWVLAGRADTLLAAPVAVGTGSILVHGNQRWVFATPRGVHVVRAKTADPVWVPPDWLYAGVARSNGFRLARLDPARPVRLSDGRLLMVSQRVVGLLGSDSVFDELPVDEHIIFDNTLFIPPENTRNRRVLGELGKYSLDLGDGYMLHGTPHTASIGTAATHGCLRLRDDDIAWLFAHVPVGTRVYIF